MIVKPPFAKTLKVKRVSVGSYDSLGIYVPGSVKTFEIVASVQPVTGKEMQYLSEGTRYSEMLKIYTDTRLRPVSEDKSAPADRVVIGNTEFEVMSVEDWSNHLNLTHFKCMLVRDNRNDEPAPVA